MRPNRFPYTKNQWEEEITLVYFGINTSLKLRAERNRITKETRHEALAHCEMLKGKGIVEVYQREVIE